MTVEFYLTRRFGLIFEVVQGKGMHTSHRHICCIAESSFLYYPGFALIFLLAISVQASNQLVGCLVSTYQAGYKIVSWSVCVHLYNFYFLAFGNRKYCCDTLWYNWLFLCSIYGFRTIYYQSWWHQLAPMRIFSGRRYQNMIALVKILPTILRHKNNCCCKSRFNSLFYCFLFSFTECDVLPNRIGLTGEYVMNQIWHLYSYNC